MLQPTFHHLWKARQKIVKRVFYLPSTDLVLVPNIVPVLKASIFETKNPDEKTLNVIITAYF
ncbi:hypothetical protein LC586_02945 [Nostoc sp. CHAB 5714]|uniref:Uncharacterized protein n=2 Tax=Nostoc TaxID=1177 RepID=A0ABS8I1Z0_9NOSO|nr:hypothetical protein [Nostoc favosum CHAB5714]